MWYHDAIIWEQSHLFSVLPRCLFTRVETPISSSKLTVNNNRSHLQDALNLFRLHFAQPRLNEAGPTARMSFGLDRPSHTVFKSNLTNGRNRTLELDRTSETQSQLRNERQFSETCRSSLVSRLSTTEDLVPTLKQASWYPPESQLAQCYCVSNDCSNTRDRYQ